jgi:hypothetical protein
MNRFANNGEIAEPCGLPRSRATSVPSLLCIGADSHRRTYSRIQRWSGCRWCATALTTSSWSRLSKNPWMSRSITQSVLQQRSRHAATASNAERCGRYP